MNEFQQIVVNYITLETPKIQNDFQSGKEVVSDLARIVGYCYALHNDLALAGQPVQFGQ